MILHPVHIVTRWLTLPASTSPPPVLKPGDLSKEISKRTTAGIANYTGRDTYRFGDVTKTAFKNYTGKDEYEFGDVTKKLMGNLFSGRKGKGKGKEGGK